MKILNALIVAIGLLTFSQLSQAHQTDEGPVALEISSSNPLTVGKTALKFQLVNNESNHLISQDDLALAHEKKLHLLIYDPSLNQFQHVHPLFTATADSTWEVEVNFSVNGNYWVWAQGEFAANGTEFSAPARIMVTGGLPELPPPQLTDSRTGEDRGSILVLSSTPLKANKMAMLGMSFRRKDGSKPQLTPYLGALAHIVATPTDGDSLIHVHPMAGSSPESAMLHVTFPEPGIYRLWIQFNDGGELKTIPLALEVK